jgi:hypothetical protein
MTATYFIDWKGKRDGPFSIEQIATLLESGEIGVLHRVETAAGLIPLKQFLIEADAARWGHLKGPVANAGAKSAVANAPASSAPARPGPNEATATPIPLVTSLGRDPAEAASLLFPGHHSLGAIPGGDSANEPAAPTPPPRGFTSTPARVQKPAPRAKPAPFLLGESAEILEAYAKSGLCFLFPPYVYWAWRDALDLHSRGYLLAADRIKWISLGLAAGGIAFWLFLWMAW